MSNITKNLNIYKDVSNLIGMRSFGKEDLVVPYRQLNGTKVGSPKIGSDFVARGFSEYDYISIPKQTITNSFEMLMKIKTPVTKQSGYQGIIGQITNNKTTPQLQYNSLYEESVECIVATSTSSEWYGSSANFKTSLNTWYWVKYVWNNGVAELLYSTNGIDYTSAGTYTVPSINWSEPMAIGKDQNAAFSGSIDLKECYIKVDDVEIWRGVETTDIISRNDMQNYVLSGIDVQPVVGDSKAVIDFSNVTLPWKFEHSDKLLTSRFAIAPLGTTVTQPKYVKKFNGTTIGSPTISKDFVASGFSDYNYFTFPLDFTNADTWEFAARVKCGALGKYQFWLQQSMAIGFDSSNRLHVWSTPVEAYSSMTFTTGVWYTFKIVYNGTQVIASYKTDDGDWVQLFAVNSAKKTGKYDAAVIGRNLAVSREHWSGQIDLENYYIKVNNEEVYRGTHWVATETETLQGCIRYYYGEGEHVTTPPRDSTQYYNVYAVNGDKGVVLDSTYFHEGTMVYNRPIVTGGEIPQFENEWYLGEYRVETGEEGSPYSPDGGYFPGGGIVLS